MQPLVSASATPAGTLISSSVFRIPPYQREYAWTEDEVQEFWLDLSRSLDQESYFLGLVILTQENDVKEVVDGQQRLITLTLLAAALKQQAIKWDRKALARRIQADFLRFIDYETDEERPRITLSDESDNSVFQNAISGDLQDQSNRIRNLPKDAPPIARAYELIQRQLEATLAADPFKELGRWAEFIREKLYFAVFVHPDSASAYRVFEVINTRGRGLTTADLLKNYVLSQSAGNKKPERYDQWQRIAKSFPASGTNSFVQYIRHIVTVRAGHVLPKDLYDYLSSQMKGSDVPPPSVPELMKMLDSNLALYLQMIDPTLDGPASDFALEVFSALNELGVMSVRPLLLAIHKIPDSQAAYESVLRLVVLRMVVGNLGTGNVERRLGEAARRIAEDRSWTGAEKDLSDLIPAKEDFVDKLVRRSLSKGMLAYVRRSVIEHSITPGQEGFLQYIVPPHASVWDEFSEEDISFYGRTIGNTILCTIPRRPHGIESWADVKEQLFPEVLPNERTESLERRKVWNIGALVDEADALSRDAVDVWY